MPSGYCSARSFMCIYYLCYFGIFMKCAFFHCVIAIPKLTCVMWGYGGMKGFLLGDSLLFYWHSPCSMCLMCLNGGTVFLLSVVASSSGAVWPNTSPAETSSLAWCDHYQLVLESRLSCWKSCHLQMTIPDPVTRSRICGSEDNCIHTACGVHRNVADNARPSLVFKKPHLLSGEGLAG